MIGLFEQDRPLARTIALFASEDLLERYDLQVELPIIDLKNGKAEAYWGEPYIAPLLFAFDEYELVGALHLERSNWAFYEIYLGEIEEASDAFRSVEPKEWKELLSYLTSLRSSILKERVATHPDRFPRRVETWNHRFLKRLAELLEEVAIQREIGHLVLLGPQEETSYLSDTCPKISIGIVIRFIWMTSRIMPVSQRKFPHM